MSENAERLIRDYAEEGAALRSRFFSDNASLVDRVARTMAVALARGGKLLFCGNGGSAADAQHLAAEFVNRFELERPSLPALALTTDTSVLTAIGNDYGYEHVFAKQVQSLAAAGDVVVGISTSGNSPNVLAAMRAAREKGCVTVGLAGRNGAVVPLCDFAPARAARPHGSGPGNSHRRGPFAVPADGLLSLRGGHGIAALS